MTNVLILNFRQGFTKESKKAYCSWTYFDIQKSKVVEGYQNFVPAQEGFKEIPPCPFVAQIDVSFDQVKFGGELKNMVVIESIHNAKSYTIQIK
jgi:hypothetical protein